MTVRLEPRVRTGELLEVALRVATEVGWRELTRDLVATAAGVSPALVSARLGTMAALKRSVMRAAVKRGVFRVVAEGLAARDPYAQGAPETLKREVAAWLTR